MGGGGGGGAPERCPEENPQKKIQPPLTWGLLSSLVPYYTVQLDTISQREEIKTGHTTYSRHPLPHTLSLYTSSLAWGGGRDGNRQLALHLL